MNVTPTLYILMREDLPDMNPGKAMAQAAHAQADFDHWVSKWSPYDAILPYVKLWKEDRTFGRTLVLQANLETICRVAYAGTTAGNEEWFGGGVTVDPTYPWRNFYGKLMLTNEITCGWCFVCDATPSDQLAFLQALPLHQ